jgi:uncharacterized protein YneF (UPF0154 family)
MDSVILLITILIVTFICAGFIFGIFIKPIVDYKFNKLKENAKTKAYEKN